MKPIQMIMATTHVDLHNECLTREALEDFAQQLKKQYLPINYEHDIRYPPFGRVVSAEVVQLPDGAFAIQATGELFESSDSLTDLKGDGREIPIDFIETPSFSIQYDRTFRDEDGKELIQDLHRLSKSPKEPVEFVKKALTPIQVLMISSGVYVVGSIAKGFLSKLGSDLYEKMRDVLLKYYRKRGKSESILDFCFSVKEGETELEVHVLVVNPTEQKVSEIMESRFAKIDNLISSLPLEAYSVSSVVIEYKEKDFAFKYAVRKDSVPIMFEKKNDSSSGA